MKNIILTLFPYLQINKNLSDTNNLLTSIWVLGIHLLFFTLWVYLYLRLKSSSNIIDMDLRNDNLNFEKKSYLSSTWTQYTSTFIDYKGKLKTEELSETYFNNTILEKILNLRIWLSIPGTFVGLGILGTFVGLTFGVSNFNLDSTIEIQNSIKNLLGGIGTAFLTSLHGIGLSIIFSFIEKHHFKNFSVKINMLCSNLDNKYKLSKKELIDIDKNKQFEIINIVKPYFFSKQQELLESINKFNNTFEEKINQITDENKTCFKSIEDQLLDLLQTKDSEGNLIKLVNIQRDLLIESEKQSSALESFSTDLAEIIIDKFEESTKNTILPKFSEILDSLSNINIGFNNFSSEAGKDIGNGVNSAIESLQGSISDVLNNFKESFNTGTSSQLNKVVQALDESAKIIEKVPESFQSLYSNINKSSEDEIKKRENIISTELNNTIEKFSKSIDVVIHNLQQNEVNRVQNENNIIEVFNKNIENKHNKLSQEYDTVVSNVGKFFNQIIDNFENTSIKQKIKTEEMFEIVRQESIDRQDVFKIDMYNLMQSYKTSFSSIIEEIKSLESEQVKRERSILNIVEKSLNQTIDKVKDLLSVQDKYQEYIEGLLKSVTGVTDKGFDLVDKYISNTKVIEEVAKTLDKSASSLKIGFENLENASDKLGKVSILFDEDFKKLYDVNKRAFGSIQDSLNTSYKTMSQLTDDYSKIQLSLSTIFNDIDKGLKSYTHVTKKEINNTLSSFTNSLSEGTNSLSQSIELLNDFFDEISDKLDKK